MSLNNKGYAGIWLLMIFVAVGVGFYAVWPRPPSAISYVIYGIAAVILGAGLWHEMRRDLYSFAQVGFVFTFTAGIISGATVFLSQEIGMPSLIVFIASIVGFITSIAIIAQTEWGKDDLPNVIKKYVDWSRVYEVDGVQFTASQNGSILRSSEEVIAIEFMVQNTWDVEREICFSLASGHRPSVNRSGLLFEKEPRITLGPVEVARLVVGVKAPLNARDNYSLTLHPKVKGPFGKRIRKKRATVYTPPTRGLTTLGGLLVGVLVTGGGMKFGIHVAHTDSTSPIPLEPLEPLEPYRETLWTLDDASEEAA